MAAKTPEVFEFLLNCQICMEPFDQKVRIPRVLPCLHTFCSPCIAKLDRGGNLACPYDRKEFRVSGPFPVDFTRAAVVEHKDDLLQKGGASSPLEEACQKHQDKKLEFFCSTCKSALCSECAVIEHGNKVGHKIVKLGDVLKQVKREIESRSKELDNIRESSLQPQAKMAATSLQETDASFKAAEQEIEDVFSEAVNVLLDRKVQAVEELRSRWKEDRIALEDQAAAKQSLVSSARTSTALGRTVSSVGLPSHIVAQEQELERAVQEARTQQGKPLLSSVLYKVKKDLSGLVQYVQELGSLVPVRSQSRESKPAEQQTKQTKTVTSGSTGVPTAPTVTSWPILTPEFQLEPSRCRAECTLKEDGRTLTNNRNPKSGGTGQSGPRPFSFLGTCGSVDLAQPALHYWTVKFRVIGGGFGDRCEFGLASLQTLYTCNEGQRISDHDVNSATLVVVQNGDKAILEGRNWTKDVDTPQPRQSRDVTYTCLWEGRMESRVFAKVLEAYVLEMTLGFLYDNRQPRSPRLLVVEAESCRLLGVRRLSPSPDLRPVFRVWPVKDDWSWWDARLEVWTGPIFLKDTTARLQSLLERMDR